MAFKAEDGSTVSLHESLVLLEWVDERWAKDAPALLPAGPTERARARIIISRCVCVRGVAWARTVGMRAGELRTHAHAVAQERRALCCNAPCIACKRHTCICASLGGGAGPRDLGYLRPPGVRGCQPVQHVSRNKQSA